MYEKSFIASYDGWWIFRTILTPFIRNGTSRFATVIPTYTDPPIENVAIQMPSIC